MPSNPTTDTFVSDKRTEALLEFFGDSDEASASEAATHLRVSIEVALCLLRAMTQRGHLERVKLGTHKVAWRLAEEPYGSLPGDLPPHLRASSIFEAGRRIPANVAELQ